MTASFARGVLGFQPLVQRVAGTAEGIGRGVAHLAKGGQPMAEIIGAAEHDDKVRVIVHFSIAAQKVLVPHRLGRDLFLGRDAGAADAVVAGSGQVIQAVHVRHVAGLGAGGTRALGDAAA